MMIDWSRGIPRDKWDTRIAERYARATRAAQGLPEHATVEWPDD